MTTAIRVKTTDLLRATPAQLHALARVCHSPGAVPPREPTRPRPYVRGDGKRFDKRTGVWR